MDVAAFVGLAERGPIDRAVVIESFDEYLASFGAAGGGRLLGQSVYLFFANGGRRCVVVRAAAQQATTAVWQIPNVLIAHTINPLQLSARDPGAWGDRLAGSFRYTLHAAPVRPIADAWPYVVVLATTLTDGAMLRRVFRTAPSPTAPLAEDLGQLVLVTRDQAESLADLRPEALDSVRKEARAGSRIGRIDGMSPATDDELATLEEVRLDVDVAMPELSESFVDLGLLPEHPRYALDVLGRSSLVRPSSERPPLAPPGNLLLTGSYALDWDADEHVVSHGNDASRWTQRRDFFQGPPGKPSPLDLLDGYDDDNELQPVSMINLPDLVHPLQNRDLLEPDSKKTEQVPGSTQFDVCTAAATIEKLSLLAEYPLLAVGFSLQVTSPDPLDPPHPNFDRSTAREWQEKLVGRCDAPPVTGDIDGPRWWGRVAILDLPPGLAAAQVLEWRRAVASARGCAALYAPHLRGAPVEDPLAPLLTTPPGGAAAGIIARREARLGVASAPANEQVFGIVSLFQDGLLPDPGFLHQARIDLVRATERGPTLLGARTTSDDPEWTHLSIRRLFHWLERQLAIDTRWAAFEPNDRFLWSRLARGVERRLTALQIAGALAGATPAESYFVRCDEQLNAGAIDRGRVVVQVGVAPSVPSEFIVFELTQLVGGNSIV